MNALSHNALRIAYQVQRLPAEQREEYIAQESNGDDALTQEVQRLLKVAAGKLTNLQASDARQSGVPPMFPGREIVPDYYYLEKIGQGGMAVVYKAHQASLNRIVAVKIILDSAGSSNADLARLRTEAEIIANLQHPNIVPLYEVGEYQGRPFFSMEFCGGGSLDHKLKGGVPAPAEAARLVETLARAMQAVHQLGIVHRDLKPANVLLTVPQGAIPEQTPLKHCTPKITDFGVAKQIEGGNGLTRTGTIMGTPNYMAPEQAETCKDVGPAADVYALGAILYECLTGRPPFQGPTGPNIVQQVIYQEPVLVRRLRPGCPRDLEAIVHKCLEKNPARRYADAADLAIDLRRYQECRPTQARPVGAAEWVTKWVRRKPTMALALALFALMLVGGLIGAFVLLDRNLRLLQVARSYMDKSDPELLRGSPDALNWLVRAHRTAMADPRFREDCRRLLAWRAQALAGTSFVHDATVRALAFSPDARHVFTGSDDGITKLWRTATGELLTKVSVGAKVRDASFSPDGRTLLVVLEGKGAELRKADNLELIRAIPCQPIPQGGMPVQSARFSPDGCSILTIGPDNTLHIQTVGEGKTLSSFKVADGVIPETVVGWARDGQHLLTVNHGSGTVRLWDAKTGQRLREFAHRAFSGSAELSPDGRFVVTNSNDSAQLWEASKGQLILAFPHGSGIHISTFSPDNRFLLTGGGQESCVRLWEVASGKLIGSIPHRGEEAMAASFSPDGQLVLTRGDATVQLWRRETTAPLGLFTNHGRINESSQVLFSPNGRFLLLADSTSARLWDLAAGEPTRSVRHNGTAKVAISLDGHSFVTMLADGRSADLHDTRLPGGFRQLRSDSPMYCFGFSPDGALLVTGAEDGTIRGWDARTGSQRYHLSEKSQITNLAFSSDGARLLTVSREGIVGTWEAASGKSLGRLRLDEAISDATFSSDGGLIAARGDKTVQVWDTTMGHRIATLPASGSIRPSFSRNGSLLLTGSTDDGTAQVWEISSARPYGTAFRHDAGVYCAFFSPSGKLALTGSWDRTARIWEVDTGKLLHTLDHERTVWCAAFSPDSQLALTGNADSTARLWDVSTGKLLRIVPHEFWVNKVAFDRAGESFMTHTAPWFRCWQAVPPSAPSDDRTLAVWVRVRTGRDFNNEQGGLQMLSAAEWEASWRELQERGGDWVAASDDEAWHRSRVREADGTDSFAARFHNQWLAQLKIGK